MKHINIIFLMLISALLPVSGRLYADTYNIDVSADVAGAFHSDMKLGTNLSPKGDSLGLTTKYFTKNGKPWYPVMGEMHYVRIPESDWEDEIIKMKLSGIDIIATYVFWIYHEEKQNEFDWEGIRSLKKFASLCTKHDIYLFLRVGPWCHGEVRNGGLPDWIMNLEGGIRRNNPAYLDYVRTFFREINRESKDNYFKNGGTIIGAQIENEYRFNNEAGLSHMLTLKEMAREEGIDVPYYTATGWPGSDARQRELLCVWGAYPEAPWSKSIRKLPLSENYVFGELGNDKNIGVDLFSEHDVAKAENAMYPYATAEMGGGNQITYHRRPVIESDDVTALSYVKIGSGANLIGYYMYHGGSNLIGKYSTLQESRATKYPNDYPIISYDFFSPIGEWGDLRESYHGFKKLHLFLNDFGDRLAPTNAFFADRHSKNTADTDTLRMGIRAKDGSGFIFISNFQRSLQTRDHHNVRFNIKTQAGTVSFPEKGMSVKANEQMVLPFNMDINGANLVYSTAQPLCILKGKIPTYVFYSSYGTSEFCLDSDNIKSLSVDEVKVKNKKGRYVLSVTPTINHKISFMNKSGKRCDILVLTAEEAMKSWKLQQQEQDLLCLFDGEIVHENNKIKLRRFGDERFDFEIYPNTKRVNVIYSNVKEKKNRVFREYNILMKKVVPEVRCTKYESGYGFKNLRPELPEDNRLVEVSETCPGPRYCVNMDTHDESTYWKIYTKGISRDVSDIKISIDYLGDTGSLYRDGELVADDYYCGLPFNVNLKRFGIREDVSLLFQVFTPPADHKIFMENNAWERLKESDNLVKSVRAIPQYEVQINIEK